MAHRRRHLPGHSHHPSSPDPGDRRASGAHASGLGAFARCVLLAPGCELADFDPLRTAEARLAAANGVVASDLAFLGAHTRNLLADRGQVVLLDFEAAAYGPREWDLLPTAIAVERYGLAEDWYRQFAGIYGSDVRAWDGYPVLREVRELTITTWIMQNIGESPAVAAEFALRVASLRERDFERAWNFF